MQPNSEFGPQQEQPILGRLRFRFSNRRAYDFQEVIDDKAGTADKGTVDTRPAEQCSGIAWHHATSVLDRDLFRGILAEYPSESCPENGMGLLGLQWSGVMTWIADRPYGFIGYADTAQGVRLDIGQSQAELPVEQRFSLVGLSLLQGLTDAKDNVESGSQGDLHFVIDELIGFTQLVAPLAVTQNHVFAADIEEHRWADLTCEGSLHLGIHVLRTECDAGFLEYLSHDGKIRIRRAENDGDAFFIDQSIGC